MVIPECLASGLRSLKARVRQMVEAVRREWGAFVSCWEAVEEDEELLYWPLNVAFAVDADTSGWDEWVSAVDELCAAVPQGEPSEMEPAR